MAVASGVIQLSEAKALFFFANASVFFILFIKLFTLFILESSIPQGATTDTFQLKSTQQSLEFPALFLPLPLFFLLTSNFPKGRNPYIQMSWK